MPALTVALLQMNSNGFDQQANLTKGAQFCRKAASMGADIVLFPEMWNIGYTAYHDEVWDRNYDPSNPGHPDLLAEWKRRAVGEDGPFVMRFADLARELEVAIAITYLEETSELPRNSVTLFDRHGNRVMNYSKVHTCDFSLEGACAPGDDFYVAALDTSHGEVEVGAMICYDFEFPESARILMLKGAELILVPTSCDLNEIRTGLIQSRAMENMVGVAVANYVGEPGKPGQSVAFDGVVYLKNGDMRNNQVARSEESEGVYLANFDLDEMREYRKSQTWGNAFRKPTRYQCLTSIEVNDPFVRQHARG